MNLVEDCRGFNHLWNEKLDRRADAPPGLARVLADHAAGCEACRCLGSIYDEFALIPASWPAIPPPPDPGIRRGKAAATDARAVPPPFNVRRPPRMVAESGLALAVAASVLVAARESPTILLPIGSASPAQDAPGSSSLLLEEAFSEASTMTWDLARNVFDPAAQIGSKVLGRDGEPRADATIAPQPGNLVEAKLVSGSARHAFRFLIGPASDDPAEPRTSEGF